MKLNIKEGCWMETHYWHAKRMSMFDYYGKKIANKNFTKCIRGCYRLSKFKSVLYDRSWYKTILVKFTSAEEFGKLLWNRFKVLGEGEGMFKKFALEEHSGSFFG